MGVHADDVVLAIKKALPGTCDMATESWYSENREPGCGIRDAAIQFDAVGRDWFRAFRITVEVIDQDQIKGDLEPLGN